MNIVINNNEKAEIFVELFQYLKLFTSIISISLETERFYIQGMDSCQISIFEISLAKDWFDKYEIEVDKVISMNVQIFAKILHIHKSPQNIVLNFNEDAVDISLLGEKGDFNKEFTMPLIEYDCDRLSVPAQEYDLDIKLESKKFKGFIDELASFGDCLNIKLEDENIISLSTTSEEGGSMKLSINIDELDECSVTEGEEINCSFSIKYIQMMSQYQRISKNVELNFSNNIPMQCKYILENDDNFIRFYMAPKIED